MIKKHPKQSDAMNKILTWEVEKNNHFKNKIFHINQPKS